MNKSIQDAIKQDHDYIRRMHQSYQREQDPDEKQKFANELIRAISVHSVAEEIVVYPFLEARLDKGSQTADHSREEHLGVKKELYALDHMSVTDSGYESRLARTMKMLYSHMEEEENEILPKLKQAAWERELCELTDKFQSTKSMVPTHPHPSAPDKPPAETIVGMFQAPIDKAFDYVARKFPESKA